MGFLLQELSNGVALGLIYALMAAGLTVIFGVMDIPNFAHGELFILGPFFVAAGLASGVPLLFAIPIGLAAVGLLSALMYAGLLYPVREKGLVPVVLITVGMALILQNTVQNIWGSEPMRLRSPIPVKRLTLGPVSITSTSLLVVGLSATLLICVGLFMNRSRVGAVSRAVFQDSAAAALSGINTKRVYIATFVVGALMAAGGGVLYAFNYSVYPSIANLVIAKAFVVVIVGGLGDFRGAIAAGILLGVGETLVSAYFATSLRDLLAFGLVIVVLLLRPEGLFRKSAWAT